MKKTISINIGGIIFHIEEDGYEKLRSYLSSIQRYFSSFADSKEILSDIEGRVAERFLNKQKVESKQVISLTDVDELIAAMGTVADFEAIEQAEDILADPLESAPSQKETFTASEPIGKESYSAPKPGAAREETKATSGPRKLYRDLKRKLAGGVAAGLAYHFSIDPLWVRLAFLFAVLGLPVGGGMMGFNGEFFGGVSGFAILVYIAMWVAFPGSTTLEEDGKIKKFYRDPDRKVVGGVAAGVASYFGVDLGVVRFLWVLSILFFGSGLLVYIVLWVIAPVANTLTEKMEMQGEPITLSNIETNIKQSLNMDERNGEESAIAKLLLLPFRAIALIINSLGKLLKGVGPVLRILIGVILVGVAAMSLFGIVVGGAVFFGLTNVTPFEDMPIPLQFVQEFPSTLVMGIILVAAIPMITILLLGLTLLSNKRIVGGSVWLTLLGLWIVGIIIGTVQGVGIQRNYAKRGEVTQTVYYPVPARTLTLDQEDNDDDENVDVDIRIRGFNGGDSLKLEKTMSSKGRSREEAQAYASKLQYDLTVRNDSVLYFQDGPPIGKTSLLREQRIDLTLYVPYDKPFAITRNFWYEVSHYNERFHHLDKYELNGQDVNWETLRWAVRRDSGLVCINLPAQYLRQDDDDNQEESHEYSSFDDENSSIDLGERGTYIKQFPVRDFSKLDIGGAYSISIRQGEEFNVAADGEENDVDDLRVTVTDGTLYVKRNKTFNLFESKKWKRVGLIITMPTVEELSISGANKARVAGFTGLAKLNVDVSGASKTEIDVQTNELVVELSGASRATLRGSATSASIDLSGACKLDATGMSIQNADIDASGASKADFGRIPNVKRSTTGASKINVQE